MINSIDFFGNKVTRLIVGDNPFNGHSYIQDIFPGSEMLDYYTGQNAVKTLFQAQEYGINTFLPLANDFMIRVIRQYRNEGGNMNIIFQPYPAIDLTINLRMMLECKPIGIYHQGTTTDNLRENGNFKKLHDNIKLIKNSGVAVGLGTHDPETILQAEDEDWGIDFYMSCLYNARRDNRGEESGFITGKSKHLQFYPQDRFVMYDVIKKVQKPFVVFKPFAGGQIFIDKDESEIPDIIHNTFDEIYSNIKANDIVCMGVFQKYSDQLKQNTDIVKTVLGSLT